MYQQWKDESGDSNSAGKWQALRLDRFEMKGARVLDIGCNAGYFAGKCLQTGAETVVGIDKDPEMITLARARYPGAEFVCEDWGWPFPDEHKFDLVLFLSALHYAHYPAGVQDVLSACWESLSEDGMLVLECGAIREPGLFAQDVTRDDGSTVPMMSVGELSRMLSQTGFTLRNRGKSVKQKGDPIERYVYHCHKIIRTLVVVSGESFAGKTQLCRDLKVPTFEWDQFVLRSSKLARGVSEDCLLDYRWAEAVTSVDLSGFYSTIRDTPELYSEMIFAGFQSLPDVPVVVVDAIDTVAEGLIARADACGWRVWEATKCN